jgi:hypothetical protein
MILDLTVFKSYKPLLGKKKIQTIDDGFCSNFHWFGTSTSLHYVIVPCDWKTTMQDPIWKEVMVEEMILEKLFQN